MNLFVYIFSAQKTGADDSNIDEVCKLLRSTGYSNAPGAKRPQNYPQSFFRYVSYIAGFIRLLTD